MMARKGGQGGRVRASQVETQRAQREDEGDEDEDEGYDENEEAQSPASSPCAKTFSGHHSK